jgi:hypothetical protein
MFSTIYKVSNSNLQKTKQAEETRDQNHHPFRRSVCTRNEIIRFFLHLKSSLLADYKRSRSFSGTWQQKITDVSKFAPIAPYNNQYDHEYTSPSPLIRYEIDQTNVFFQQQQQQKNVYLQTLCCH